MHELMPTIQESHASKYYETEEHARINAHNKDQY